MSTVGPRAQHHATMQPAGPRMTNEPHVQKVAAAHADGDRVLADGLHQRRLVPRRHRLPGIQRDNPPAARLPALRCIIPLPRWSHVMTHQQAMPGQVRRLVSERSMSSARAPARQRASATAPRRLRLLRKRLTRVVKTGGSDCRSLWRSFLITEGVWTSDKVRRGAPALLLPGAFGVLRDVRVVLLRIDAAVVDDVLHAAC